MHNDQVYQRQLGIFNPAENPDAHVSFVGVGGIGSFAAYSAAKLGIPNITLFDFDKVELHNAPNQMYGHLDVTKNKVDALANQIVYAIPDTNIGTEVRRCDADTKYKPGVVVSGLDSMAARKEVWPGIKLNPSVSLYIDGRISGQIILLYAFNPTNLDAIDKYEATLHSDDEAEAASCTERGIIDVGFTVGGLITWLLRRYYAGDSIDPITYVNHETLAVTKGDWL